MGLVFPGSFVPQFKITTPLDGSSAILLKRNNRFELTLLEIVVKFK